MANRMLPNYWQECLIIPIILFIFAYVTDCAMANEKTNSGQVEILYGIEASNTNIGNLRVVRKSPYADSLTLHTKYEFNIPGYFSNTEFTMDKQLVFNGQELTSVDSYIVEGDEGIRIWGELKGNALAMNAKETGGKQEPFEYPANLYDVADEGLALALNALEDTAEGKVLRLLDTAEFEVLTSKITRITKGTVNAAGRSFDCRIFHVTTDEGEATYWIAQDDLGPYLVKEVGKDEDGPYTLAMTSYKVMP